ncbi:hypothetical protein EDB87DRAFT_1609965 [Lactarius vividus]|nr:hypothetical protein EDB87DRAFT_1609965 [Lactarius vividus]
MVEVLSILGIVTKEVGQGIMKKSLKKLVGRKDIEDALQRLDNLTREEVRMARAEALKISCEIDDRTKDVSEKVEGVDEKVWGVSGKAERINVMVQGTSDKVQDVKDKINLVIAGEKETKVESQRAAIEVSDLHRRRVRQDLRKWISPPDPSINYSTACDTHYGNTATWCTQGNTFADWKASGSLLWVHGKPGSGKSILSSAIIRDIKDSSGSIAYFYFDFTDTRKQDSRALLSSLLVQLSDQSDRFCDILHGLYSKCQGGSERPNEASLLRCLKDMLNIAGPGPVYFVMDGLDECPNSSGLPSPREKVLELVEEFIKLRLPRLRLCVTSRSEFDICTVLEPLKSHQLSLDDENGQKKDITYYITSVVRSDRWMKKWKDEEKDLVIEKLVEKAGGM